MLLRKEVALLPKQLSRFENLKEDGKAFQCNTGLIVRAWNALWTILKPTSENILSAKSVTTETTDRQNRPSAGRKLSLSLENQLLLTLMRLRLGSFDKALASQFGVHASNISKYLSTWIIYLYLRLGLIPTWPEWEVVESAVLAAFLCTYPTTFCTIDATELRCAKEPVDRSSAYPMTM